MNTKYPDQPVVYAEQGCPTGGFLEAVLSNDLARAMGRADSDNRSGLFHIVDFIYNDALCNVIGGGNPVVKQARAALAKARGTV